MIIMWYDDIVIYDMWYWYHIYDNDIWYDDMILSNIIYYQP